MSATHWFVKWASKSTVYCWPFVLMFPRLCLCAMKIETSEKLKNLSTRKLLREDLR